MGMTKTLDIVNIAEFLPILAHSKPEDPAIYCSQRKAGQYKIYTYSQLNQESDWIAGGLLLYGFKPKSRIVLMVKPSLEFFALVFGMFKAGIVPVIIDPGLEKAKLKHAIDQVDPEGFIGIPLAQITRILLGWGKKSIKRVITVGPRLAWGGTTLATIRTLGQSPLAPTLPITKVHDIAAVLFTSGSTGTPKGAVYTHGNFLAQVQYLKESFNIQPGEIDVPTFPLFALFDPALEMVSVIPYMDFSKPAKANPEKIIRLVHDFNATNLFASPALLDNLCRYAINKDKKLPSLKRAISAGAPVHPKIVVQFRKLIKKESDLYTAYGATEALPVSIVSGNEILQDTQIKTDAGWGICVGKLVPPLEVKIIRICEHPLKTLSEELELKLGEIGEIIVCGAQVTSSYFGMADETTYAKIPLINDKRLYHRMGDVGYFDDQGRLWYCGRKSHRVVTIDKIYFTEVCEGIFNQHPAIYRTALVGVTIKGQIHPVICVELEADKKRQFSSVLSDLLNLAKKFPQTNQICHFLHHKKLPVDIRHNAKINREKVALWADKELNG